ncbi:hypothetical protein C8F01DRAFT_1227967, partial [Mycena amicta]
ETASFSQVRPVAVLACSLFSESSTSGPSISLCLYDVLRLDKRPRPRLQRSSNTRVRLVREILLPRLPSTPTTKSAAKPAPTARKNTVCRASACLPRHIFRHISSSIYHASHISDFKPNIARPPHVPPTLRASYYSSSQSRSTSSGSAPTAILPCSHRIISGLPYVNVLWVSTGIAFTRSTGPLPLCVCRHQSKTTTRSASETDSLIHLSTY